MPTAWQVIKNDVRRLHPRHWFAREARALATVLVVVAVVAMIGVVITVPMALLLWTLGYVGDRLVVGAAILTMPIVMLGLYIDSVRQRTREEN